MREAPPGFHWEWVIDLSWRVGGDGRICRMNGCRNLAVAALQRRRRNSPSGFQWWHYCENHLYGQKIEDRFVKYMRAVENAPDGAA